MNALIVTTPSIPAFFALRGYAGSISPRSLGAWVVGPADPGVASPGAPVPPRGPPKLATGIAEPPGADAGAGLCEAGSARSLAAGGGSFCESTTAGVPVGRTAAADGEAARIPGGETGPAPSLLAATGCAASVPGSVRESRLTSMPGGSGPLPPAMRGTASMAACRLRATRMERPNACRSFTCSPPTSFSYSFRLTPVTRENGGMG